MHLRSFKERAQFGAARSNVLSLNRRINGSEANEAAGLILNQRDAEMAFEL
jgi:hypothetical protein